MSDGPKYPWQRFVLDAFAASDETLQEKIEIARRAITVRLNDQPQPDADEELAMRDALNTLRVLAPQAAPKPAPRKGKKKKDVA